MKLSRRNFLGLVGIGSAATAIGALSLKNLYSQSATGRSIQINKFGALKPDPKGILDLPEGFQYKIISGVGEKMNDGFGFRQTPSKIKELRKGSHSGFFQIMSLLIVDIMSKYCTSRKGARGHGHSRGGLILSGSKQQSWLK